MKAIKVMKVTKAMKVMKAAAKGKANGKGEAKGTNTPKKVTLQKTADDTIKSGGKEARCRLCSGPNNYNPGRLCYTCEFPKCAACGLERSEAAGPRYKGKHMGKITKGEPWYERPTHRPSPGTQKIN